MKACDKTLKETMAMVHSMIDLADRGDMVREDVGCGILYAVLRDSAYKLKGLVEKEREAHIRKGWWRDDENEEEG